MYFLIAILLVLVGLPPAPSVARDFLQAPVVPDGKEILHTDGRLELVSHSSYEDVVNFYRKSFESQKDVKFWDRGDETYIEDHSNRPWHSVTITKRDQESTTVVILKDNWTWVIGTLVIRFIGVFVVLFILYVALSIAGAIVSRVTEARKKTVSKVA